MDVGVDAGSMLVPELVWLSSVSMRVVGGFIMFMLRVHRVAGCSAARVFAWRACPCRACRAWAAVWSAHGGEAQLIETSGSNVVACLWGMVIPSLEDCVVGRQR